MPLLKRLPTLYSNLSCYPHRLAGGNGGSEEKPYLLRAQINEHVIKVYYTQTKNPKECLITEKLSRLSWTESEPNLRRPSCLPNDLEGNRGNRGY